MIKCKKYNPDDLRQFCEIYFYKLGMPGKDAKLLTDVLLEADLKGINSHGILRVPHYSERLLNGSIKSKPGMKFRKAGDSSVILDADDGMGHVAAAKAIEKAIDIAGKNAVGTVSVVNSSHFGIAGYFSEIAAAKNMIGIVMTHTDANTAPYGASESYIGSNALAFSAPTNESYHFTVDFSFAKISYGKIYNAKLKKAKLPNRSAIDCEGRFTANPDKVEHLCPAAEHKGYGMLLMIEVMCSLLTGIPFCRYVNDMYKDMEHPRKLGHFIMAIDISKFNSIEIFKKDISRMISDIHSLKTDNDSPRVYVHGEIEHINKMKNMSEGISIENSLAEELRRLGKSYGITFPRSN